MSFHREDLKQQAVEILKFEIPGFDANSPRYATLVQRLWDLMERGYYEGYSKAMGGQA